MKEGFIFRRPSAESPTKGGHTFIEWQLDGVSYDFTKNIREPITIKAVYEEKFMFIVNSATSVSGNVLIHGEVLSGAVKKDANVYIRGEGMELNILHIYKDNAEVNEATKGDKVSFVVGSQISVENVIDNDLMYFTDSFSEVSSFEVKVKLFTTTEGGLSTPLDVNSALNVYVWKHDINATVTRITDLEGNTVDEALPGETYVMKIKLGVGDWHIFYQSQSLAFRIGGQTFMTGTVL